jgi:hypothetical protein
MGLIIKPGNLVDHAHGGKTRTVLRGDLDLAVSVSHLKWDWYQRKEGFSRKKMKEMIDDFIAGDEFPDIILGMRGHRYDVYKGDVVDLHDDVYIIDGLQRWSAALSALREDPSLLIRLGVKLYFATNVDFERTMFRELNTRQTSMSANVILRNEKEVNRLAGSLYGVSMNTPKFALYRRVCWDQTATQGEGGDLITGVMLLNLSIELHKHLMGPINRMTILDRLEYTEQKINAVGLQQNRDNLIAFFEFIDAAWGARTPGLTKVKAPWMRAGWLATIAQILSDHEEFWRGKALFVSLPMTREFKKLDPFDAELWRLAGANLHGREVLYQLMVKQLNKGRSTNRLVDRYTKAKAREAAAR